MTGEDGARGIHFSGAFEPAERDYLASQFSHCGFELIRRSETEPSRVLLAWSATPALHRGASQGPGPLRDVPAAAAYVLHGGEDPSLVRVRTREDLAREFGDPLEGTSVPGLGDPNATWDTVKEVLKGLFPFRPR